MARISAADARVLVEELETGRGRLPDLARRNPRLVALSRSALSDLCGDPVTLFRHVSLREGQTLRSEDASSCTLRPDYALKLAAEAPGVIMTRDAFIVMKVVLLRYEVPLDRVLLYIPTAMEIAESERPEALSRMRVSGRSGRRFSGFDIIRLVRDLHEEEVIADLHGMTPETLPLPRTRDVHAAAAWLYHGPQPEELERARHEDALSLALIKKPGDEEERLSALWEACASFFARPCRSLPERG